MRPSRLVRLLSALLSASAVSLVCVPGLDAATVAMIPEDGVATLKYQAAPGESNGVVITMTPDQSGWVVSDTGVDALGPLTLTAGPGCETASAQIAFCEHNVEDVTETPIHVVLDLGDNDDTAWASDACAPLGYSEPIRCQVRTSAGDGVDLVFANDAVEPGVGAEASTVFGGPCRDFLHGGDSGSRLLGGRGGDELIGGPRRDVIYGGGGEDTLKGRLGHDELRGQAGGDIFYSDDGSRDHVFGGKGRDRARIDRGLDHVRSIERFFEGLIFGPQNRSCG